MLGGIHWCFFCQAQHRSSIMSAEAHPHRSCDMSRKKSGVATPDLVRIVREPAQEPVHPAYTPSLGAGGPRPCSVLRDCCHCAAWEALCQARHLPARRLVGLFLRARERPGGGVAGAASSSVGGPQRCSQHDSTNRGAGSRREPPLMEASRERSLGSGSTPHKSETVTGCCRTMVSTGSVR